MTTALLVAGCTPSVPLSEVPISGGTPTEREIARSTLLEFERDVGPGRVDLRSLTFEDPGGGVWGRFRRGRIVIRPDLGEDLARVVRHELCHAIDDAESLSDPAPEAVKDLLSVVEPLDVPSHEGEAVAAYCELGSFPARVLADPCPNDDERVNAMARWLVDTIWTASDPGYTLDPTDIALDLRAPLDLVTLYGSRNEATEARLEYTTAAEPELAKVVSLSLDDGVLGPALGTTLALYLVSEDTIGNPPLYEGIMHSMTLDAVTWDREAVFALEDGTAAGIFSFGGWDPMDLSAPRASVFDGEAWHDVTGSCVRPGQGLFATSDGSFSSSWIEEDTVRWGPFVRED